MSDVLDFAHLCAVLVLAFLSCLAFLSAFRRNVFLPSLLSLSLFACISFFCLPCDGFAFLVFITTLPFNRIEKISKKRSVFNNEGNSCEFKPSEINKPFRKRGNQEDAAASAHRFPTFSLLLAFISFSIKDGVATVETTSKFPGCLWAAGLCVKTLLITGVGGLSVFFQQLTTFLVGFFVAFVLLEGP